MAVTSIERRMISTGFVDEALNSMRQRGMAIEPVLAAAGLPPSVQEPVSAERYGALWRTWSETPAWFRTKLFVASDASIALSFSDVSDAHQFFTSPLRSSNNLDYRANPPHGRNTDIGCR